MPIGINASMHEKEIRESYEQKNLWDCASV